MKLGRYEVVRELGKGAMGIVYLAKDPLIGRLVALKTIRAAANADDDETREFQQRFVREAQAAGILNHPAIVTVFDIGQDPETNVSFIAMEYVEGQNLKDVLSHGKDLNYEEIADIVAQVADGLDFAHAKGIVHRDVKPANIILLEGNRAKITDFGIAKIASGASNLTSTGQFLGTPNYMAPEQIKGIAVDGRTDLFSLGIVLYECLTRRKPFGGDSLTTISYRIVHEPFPPLQEINPDIPEAFEEIVARCLAKEPGRRYQRGKELAFAVRAAARGEVVPPEPMMADETVFTLGADRTPTLEVPFPDADQPAGAYATAARGNAAARRNATVLASPSAQPAASKASRPVAASLPPALWQPVKPVLFFGIVGAFLGLVLLAIAAIVSSKPPLRPVDMKAEAARAKQRKLRQEGNDLLKAHNVEQAYEKFQELSRIAPGSPAIGDILQKLSFLRLEELGMKQRLSQAKDKFDQALALYNQKMYTESIPLFLEATQLDPTSAQAASYLTMAQEQQRLATQQKQARAGMPRVVTATSGAAIPELPTARVAVDARGGMVAPATVTISFQSPVSDGYIQVKSAGQVIAHENLWEEKGRAIFRRKVARTVSVTSAIKAQTGEIEIWVVIPSLQVQEHKVLRQNMTAGSAHKLVVTFDKTTKHFDYAFS